MQCKWWLVIAGCVTHAFNTGFSYFGMSAFFPSFEGEFGWSAQRIGFAHGRNGLWLAMRSVFQSQRVQG